MNCCDLWYRYQMVCIVKNKLWNGWNFKVIMQRAVVKIPWRLCYDTEVYRLKRLNKLKLIFLVVHQFYMSFYKMY